MIHVIDLTVSVQFGKKTIYTCSSHILHRISGNNHKFSSMILMSMQNTGLLIKSYITIILHKKQSLTVIYIISLIKTVDFGISCIYFYLFTSHQNHRANLIKVEILQDLKCTISERRPICRTKSNGSVIIGYGPEKSVLMHFCALKIDDRIAN